MCWLHNVLLTHHWEVAIGICSIGRNVSSHQQSRQDRVVRLCWKWTNPVEDNITFYVHPAILLHCRFASIKSNESDFKTHNFPSDNTSISYCSCSGKIHTALLGLTLSKDSVDIRRAVTTITAIG